MKTYRISELGKIDRKIILACENAGFGYYRIREDEQGEGPMLYATDSLPSARMTHRSSWYDEKLVLIPLKSNEKVF